ncbi:sigma-70 family RNA polymerase sigma factor [Streptomyces sudanensis]|uniref:RNA polymerase sigma factor n=1 Tax=Streptomyces sudanensis TaxID=436397 RepID=UPI0020CC2D57|nr:sigma-70 family RNA polymerase sigma factor [Streptomyces sudanensis]MCP9986774.1 sigma-70 family RNA polymerase sigma factor [Streptomyces sudanensis]
MTQDTIGGTPVTAAPDPPPEAVEAPERVGAPGPAEAPEAMEAPGPAAATRPVTPVEAFETLYACVAPDLVRQAYLLTGRRRAAREAVERAFHQAWDHWPEVAVDRDPAGWVRAAAHGHALSPWHRLRHRFRLPDPPAGGPVARALRDALLELPPPYRRTLLLHDGLGVGLPEVAAETEASSPATAHRLLHARGAVAERVPPLADPDALREHLAELLQDAAVALAPPEAVRAGGERRVWLWTRATAALSALIAMATAFTLATAPTRYEPPPVPGAAVTGVPALGGPERSERQDERLRLHLDRQPVTGPARLVPSAR